jgi:hypothetical protein
MCLTYGVPTEGHGDHSECSIELIACPAHRDEQMQAIGYKPGEAVAPSNVEPEESSMFRDAEGNKTIGFCLWCNRDFYSMNEVEAHNANDMAACEAFQELKGHQGMPPVLQAMSEEAGILPNEDPDDETELAEAKFCEFGRVWGLKGDEVQPVALGLTDANATDQEILTAASRLPMKYRIRIIR